MFNATRSWLLETKTRRWCFGLFSTLLLIASITLTVNNLLVPAPPDPANADAPAIAGFLTSEAYQKLSSQQRENYFRNLADRYATMSYAERKAFESNWQQVRDSAAMRHQIEVQMGLALARKMSNHYATLSIDERPAYLDRVLGVLQVMGSRADDFNTWVDRNPVNDMTSDPKQFKRNADKFKRDILPSTNARERASMYQLGGDLLARARQRRQ